MLISKKHVFWQAFFVTVLLFLIGLILGVYFEVRELEFLDDSNKITKATKSLHRKYDLLRAILWVNTIKIREDYPDLNSVVYLYIYDTADIEVKSKQIVMSKVLSDLKEKKGKELILIPIAVDSDISSLDYLLQKYDLTEFPIIFINEAYKISDVPSVEELESYLNNSHFT